MKKIAKVAPTAPSKIFDNLEKTTKRKNKMFFLGAD